MHKLTPRAFLLILLLSFLSILIVITYKHYGTTWDEEDMISLGNHALAYYISLGKDTSYLTLFGEPEFYLTHGFFIEVLRTIIIKAINNYSINTYHLILALMSLSAYFFLFKIVHLVTKNVFTATGSFLLLLFMPRFYGDMFTNSKDIAPAFVLLGTIYFSLLYFSGKRKAFNLLLLGGFFAIGAGLRIVLLYVYGLFFILSFLKVFMEEKKSIKIYFFNQLLIFISFFIVFYATQPYFFTKSIRGIIDMLSASQNFPWNHTILFEGKMWSAHTLPWYYLPKWMAISTPFITLCFFIYGNIHTVNTIFNRRNSQKYMYLYILSIFWLPIILVIYKHPVVYDAWRHFLFLAGPLIILASIGFNALLNSKIKIVTWAALIIFAINILSTSHTMIKLHPYEYIYFNSLVGGLKGAYGKYETDYWGASFKEATEWIYNNRASFTSSDGNVYISPCLPHLTFPYLKAGMIVNHQKAILYYCYTRWDKDQKYHGQTLYVVKREGIPLNIIKIINQD